MFSVTSRTGVVQEFKGVEIMHEGHGWTLILSELIQGQLKPGNYTVSIFVNGQVRTGCFPLSILRYAGQPYINTMNCSGQLDCADRSPVLLKQGQRVLLGLPYYVMGWEKAPSKYLSATLSRAKLVDVNDPGHVEFATVTLPRVVEINPAMTLSADIKPGRYQLTYQIGYGDEIFESEPFVRDIEIK